MPRKVRDAAGDAGRGDDPPVHHVEHVPDDGRARVAAGEFVLHVMVGRAAAAVQQPGPAERVGSRTHAGHGAARRVVVVEPAQRPGIEVAVVGQAGRAPARDDDQVVGPQYRQFRVGAQHQPLGGGHVLLLGRVVQAVAEAVVGRGGEHLGRPREVEQMQPRDEQEDHPGHDPVSSSTVVTVAKRPARAYSVLAMTSAGSSVRGSARTSASGRPAGASRCAIGSVAVASLTKVTW